MKYLLMIYMNDATWESLSEAERNEVFSGHDEFIKAITESGEMVGTEALANPSNSATVRVRDGVTVVTDGPYLETKEYLASWYLLEVENEQRALEIAAEIPAASLGQVEVWPILHEAKAKF